MCYYFLGDFFYSKKISFWLAKTSEQPAFADSRQLFWLLAWKYEKTSRFLWFQGL